jgi:hypothetical protein
MPGKCKEMVGRQLDSIALASFLSDCKLLLTHLPRLTADRRAVRPVVAGCCRVAAEVIASAQFPSRCPRQRSRVRVRGIL